MISRSLRQMVVLLCLLLVGPSLTFAQAKLPQSPRAAKARATYRKAIGRAAAAYEKELDRSLKEAAAKKDKDEVERIVAVKTELREKVGLTGDPVAKSRKRLENTRWTFVRPGDGEVLTLKAGNALTTSRANGQGTWAMLDARTAVIYMRIAVFTIQFNESFTNYKVEKAFSPVPTKFTGGQRVK